MIQRLFLIVVVVLISISGFSQTCLPGWKYMKRIDINNPNTNSLTDFQVKLSINTQELVNAGKMLIDGRDIRFTNSSGTFLPFWLEEGTINSVETKIWVKVDNLNALSTNSIYFYYGNSAAFNFSDGESTFLFFDDFNSNLNNKWITNCNTNQAAISDGRLKISSTPSLKVAITGKSSVNGPSAACLRVYSFSGNTGFDAFISLQNISDNGYSLCCDGSNMNIRVKSSSSGCFTHQAPTGSSIYHPGNNYWYFSWLSGSLQKGSANGTIQKVEEFSEYYEDYTFPPNYYPSIGIENNYASLEAEWFFVKKYAANESFTITPGSEIALTTTPNIVVSNNSPLCAGENLQLLAGNIPGANFTWTFKGATFSGIEYTKVASTNDDGVYTLTVTTSPPNPCPTYKSYHQVVVNPSTEGGIVDGTTHVCAGNNSGSAALTGSVGTIKRWEYSETGQEPWYAINNTNNVLNYSNLLTSTSFRAVVKSGTCAEAISQKSDITVDELPIAGLIEGAENVCYGSDVSLTIKGFKGNIKRWQKSDNKIDWKDSLITSSSVTFENLSKDLWVRAEVGNGTCSNVFTEAVKVPVILPSVAGTFELDTICKGGSGQLNLQGERGNVVRWEMSANGVNSWVSIIDTIRVLPYKNLLQTTWFRAVVKNGVCEHSNTASIPVIVDQPVNPGILSGSDTVCSKDNSGLLKLSSYSGVIERWEKSFNSSSWSVISNKTDSFRYNNIDSRTFYRVFLRSQYGFCTSLTSANAEIQISIPTIPGTIDGSTTVCQTSNSGKLSLENYNGSVLRWEKSNNGNDSWTVINNTKDSLIYKNLIESTWYRVLVKSGRCKSLLSSNAAITVDRPVQKGVLTGAKSVCAFNNEGTLVLTSYYGFIQKWEQSLDRVKWITIQNTTNELKFNNLQQTTYYRVILSNGVCSQDTSEVASIIVYSLPKVNFKADTADVGKTTYFANTSTTVTGKLLSFMWDFGNGYSSTAKDPEYVYTKSGIFSVKLIVTTDKGCTDSLRKNVLVKAMPKPDFEFENVCFGSNIKFKNTSVINIGGMDYYWDFGDGAFSEEKDIEHLYAKSGIYKVKLTVISDLGARDSIVKYAEVYYRSTPAFAANEVCFGNPTSFINKSSLEKGSMNFFWIFNDSTSRELNPLFSFKKAGNHIVKLVVTTDKNCTDSTKSLITVNPVPKVKFGATYVPYKEPTVFTDSSKVESGAIAHWKWNFGDASFSDEQNVSHIYKAPGNYLVNLVVETDKGCFHENSMNIVVFDLPHASFINQNVCRDDSMFFVNKSEISSGGLSYSWDFADGSFSTAVNPVHLYKHPGKYQVVLIAISDKDARDTLAQTVEVYPKPDPYFEVAGVCKGAFSKFINKSTIASGSLFSYTWDFGDGSNSIQADPEKLFADPKTYKVKLTVLSDKSCLKSIEKNAEVYSIPVANFETRNVCIGSLVRFSNLSYIKNGNLQYNWNFGDYGSSKSTNPDHEYLLADTFIVKLIAQSELLCLDSIEKEVVVYSLPKVEAGKDTTITFGFPIQLKANGGKYYDWQPADGLDNPGVSDPFARPKVTTTYVVRAIDNHECVNSDSLVITVIDKQVVIPTNVFTPNGDGVNDYWTISNIDYYEKATIYIYNRWGQLVYHKTNYLQDWNGKNSNGDVLPDGTYYYVIKFADSNRFYSGAVTLLRDK